MQAHLVYIWSRVTVRLTDTISRFYAEIKRLKVIGL